MKDITYILPTRIDSDDRLRNTITSVTYLIKNFPEAKILVKEVDKQSIFKQNVLPKINTLVEVKNLTHIFEKSTDAFFHKTRILNDLILEADTEVVASHDVDVVYPLENHQSAYYSIINGVSDIVYPYGCGVYQFKVNSFSVVFENFLKSDFNFDVIQPYSKCDQSTINWSQFYNRKKVIEGYMWNENFLNSNVANREFYYRFNRLGYSVNRYDGVIWHFEHDKVNSQNLEYEKMKENNDLWQWIREQDSNNLDRYYKNQEYLKLRHTDACV